MTTGSDQHDGADERDDAEKTGSSAGPSATKDLADGLELMLRAARKAMKNVDPAKLEELGRRAMRGLEQVDRQKVQELGRKAVKNFDPRRVEEVAEDAGKELIAVVERVAERIDGMIARSRPEAGRQDSPPERSDAEQRRIRVESDDE